MSRRPVPPELLETSLDLFICAMAVGTRSAEPGAYYVHGKEKSWRS